MTKYVLDGMMHCKNGTKTKKCRKNLAGDAQMDETIKSLYGVSIFDKKLFFETVIENVGELSKSSLEKYLKKYLQSGEIARIGRNAYCFKGNLRDYEYDYSDLSIHIAKVLNDEFYELDFRIFELYQMNRFLNHQIAHNVIFVFVEKELCTSAFERLKKEYEGNVLINPTEDDLFNYRREDMIVVRNLLTESPKGKKRIWHTDLEKILVDIFSENLIKVMFSESEYPAIYEEAFGSYVIDESQMFRYAKRRKSADRIKKFIKEETNVKLRLA